VNSVLAANGVIRRGEERIWELITSSLLALFPRTARRGLKSSEENNGIIFSQTIFLQPTPLVRFHV
jgi:hypothetical protein